MDKKGFKFLVLIFIIFIITIIAVLIFTKNSENNILPKQKKEIIINEEIKAVKEDIQKSETVNKKEPIRESPIQGVLLN